MQLVRITLTAVIALLVLFVADLSVADLTVQPQDDFFLRLRPEEASNLLKNNNRQFSNRSSNVANVNANGSSSSPWRTRIACVGDSITYGACTTSPSNYSYPHRLQQLLGPEYEVVNLGVSGACMQRNANFSYWTTSKFQTFISERWDVVIVMLGTNDAKDNSSGGPDNWPHTCTTGAFPHLQPKACPFTEDYSFFLRIAKQLARKPDAQPDIYVMTPPPLMDQAAYGMNKSVINHELPVLIPYIANVNGLRHDPISVFDALGGSQLSSFPKNCTLSNGMVAGCRYFCNRQSCDQCHPNDVGQVQLAATVFETLLLDKESLGIRL